MRNGAYGGGGVERKEVYFSYAMYGVGVLCSEALHFAVCVEKLAVITMEL